MPEVSVNNDEQAILQQKTIEFLKALDAESGGKEIKLNDYVLKLGENAGLKNKETLQLIKSLHGKGYIRLTPMGNNSSIAISQMGRKQIEGDKKGIPFNVFISHVHENEPIANKIKEIFTTLFGEKIYVFISGDPNNIPAGEDFFTTIIHGIQQCDYMIILCSPESVKRYYIYFEAGGAAVLGRKIIPLCFGGQSPGALPTPLDHIRAQAIDGDNPEKLRQHFKILIKEIADKIGIDISVRPALETEFFQALQIKKTGPAPQNKFELTMIGMFNLGHGQKAVGEYSLNKVQGLSKTDLFDSLEEAEKREFIIDASSHDGNAWLLSQKGIRYVKALLEQSKK